METGASWKIHSNRVEPKRKGISLEPEQETVDPSAVMSLTPETVEVEGAGKTEMDAPVSTRKRRFESESRR